MIIDELVAVLGFKLEGDADRRKFEQGLKRAERSVDEFSRSVSTFARRAIMSIGAIGTALGVSLSVKSIVGVNAQFEGFAATLETIEGSSEKAKKSLDWVAQFAKTTPYEVSEVTAAFVRLRAYGMDPMDGTLKALGDTASGMGKPLMQAVEAMADAATGEFERLKEFGIKAKTAGNQVTFSWQKDGKEFRKTIAKNGTEITKFLRDTLGGRFENAMERQSKTFTGLVSNLSDSWVDFQRRIGEAGFFDAIKKRLEGLLATIARLDADGTLNRWAENISDTLEGAAAAFDYVAGQISDNVTTLSRLWSENREKFNEFAMPIMVGLVLIAKKLIPFWFWLGLTAAAVNDLLKYLEGAPSVLEDFIESFAWFLGTEPEAVAEALGTIVKAAAGLAGIAFGVGLLAGAFRRLSSALSGLSKFAGLLGRLAGFKWAAAAGGAAAVATAATGAAAATAGATGTAAAGVAGNAASKAPWLPGMRSPLGRLLGPVGTIGSTGFDIKSRMDRLAVLTEQNGGDQVKALEELQRENSLSVYEAADKMTKVLDAIKENTQGLLEKMGLGWMMGGRSGSGYEGSPAHGAAGARSTSAVAGAIEGNTYRGGPYSDEMAAAIKQSAAELGISPEDLATAISYETAGTFDPWKRGPTTRWGTHRGLIQWGEPQRRQYGVTENSTVGEQMKAVTKYLKDRGVKPGHGLLEVYSAINAGGVGQKFYGRSDAHAGGAPGSVRDKVNNQMHAHRAKARRLLAAHERQQRQVAESNGSETAQNLAGNLARVEGATAATNATLVREHRAVTQNITVGDVHAAPGERVDRATARAVAGAAAGAGRPQQVARIAAEPAALP